MAVVAVATSVIETLGKIKPIAKFVGKLPIGGVTQDRFFDRYYEIKDIFKNAGYGVDTELYGKWLDKFKIRKTQIESPKRKGNYYNEFQRLRDFTINWLNYKNPGLGDVYGAYVPEFAMNITEDGTPSLGQMDGEPIKYLKEFVKIKPGAYKPGMIPAPERTVAQPYSNKPDLTKSPLAAAVDVIIDEAGKAWAKDEYGNKMYQVNPDTGERLASGGNLTLFKENWQIMAAMIAAVIVLYLLFKK